MTTETYRRPTLTPRVDAFLDGAPKGLWIDGGYRPALSGELVHSIDPSSGGGSPACTRQGLPMSMPQSPPPARPSTDRGGS